MSRNFEGSGPSWQAIPYTPPDPLPQSVDAQSVIALAYVSTLSLLVPYGVHRLWMIRHHRWGGESQLKPHRKSSAQDVRGSGVTVQLPLYNERTVAQRLLRSVELLVAPPGGLEIQILDDSTDETRELVEREVARLLEKGIDAKLIRRSQRLGFKAGALDGGLRQAKYDLLCVFDADFVPRPDFLLRSLPHFADPGIGMLQSRWGHINRDESNLTRAQATLLDGHFVIEHKVRHDEGLFFNFNGTAGIWRRQAIEDGGGWQHDTLTEDLDLSYRAQLAGWRFRYDHRLIAPAELPGTMNAFKSQQNRWARGSMQVLRKLGPRLLRADIGWRKRAEALAHLTSYIGAPGVLLIGALLPLLVTRELQVPGWVHLGAFVISTLSIFSFYSRSQKSVGRARGARWRDTLLAVALGTGMCVSQTKAILQGMFGKTGTFTRTPKSGDASSDQHYRAKLRGWAGEELLLSLWLGWGILTALLEGQWGALPFLCLYFGGFTWVGAMSLKEALSVLRSAPGQATFEGDPDGQHSDQSTNAGHEPLLGEKVTADLDNHGADRDAEHDDRWQRVGQ
mgnify:FL=1